MSFSYLAETLAIKNLGGSIVVFLRNLEGARDARICVDSKERIAPLSGHSICAIT